MWLEIMLSFCALKNLLLILVFTCSALSSSSPTIERTSLNDGLEERVHARTKSALMSSRLKSKPTTSEGTDEYSLNCCLLDIEKADASDANEKTTVIDC